MAKQRNGISGFRGFLYALARFLGDLRAVQKGPGAIERRTVRRVAGRTAGKFLGKLFRGK